MSRFAAIGVALAGLAMAAPAQSTALLTSAVGYTGPSLRIPMLYSSDYTYLNGPVSLGNGITFSSDAPNQSSIGRGGDGYYLDANGTTLLSYTIGLEDAVSTITLNFDAPVVSFGLAVNYAVTDQNTIIGNDPVISAYDSNQVLIASYDLEILAPIRTPSGIDQFAFRGITSSGAPISSFHLSGAFIVARGELETSVPEPATWAVLLAGLAITSLVLRTGRSRTDRS